MHENMMQSIGARILLCSVVFILPSCAEQETSHSRVDMQDDLQEVTSIVIRETDTGGSASYFCLKPDYYEHWEVHQKSPGGFSLKATHPSIKEQFNQLCKVVRRLYSVAGVDYSAGQIVDRGSCFTVNIEGRKPLNFLLDPGRSNRREFKEAMEHYYSIVGRLMRIAREAKD